MSSSPAGLGKSPSATTPATHCATPPSANGPQSFESPARRPSSQQSPSSSQQPTPRKGQGARKQHRSQRRPFGNSNSGQGRGGELMLPDDDAMAEINVVRNPNSRRGQTSITHLLSYTLAPHSATQQQQQYHRHHHEHAYSSSSSSYSRSYRRNPAWGSGYHAADKARYVHANYRFVVSPKGDYRRHAADADELLDWSDVLQVLASAESQVASCPICLCEPVAPRMAKCGHIFCLPCLIRFMNSSSGDEGAQQGHMHHLPDNRRARWKKCPICEDSVYISEVRPVRFYAGQEGPLPRPGDDVVLRLMVRKSRHSTLALPRETGVDVLNLGQDVPWHFAANILDYARVIKGTGAYMAEQYDEEVQALERQEKEDEVMFHEDGEWTQRAMRAVQAAKAKVVAELGGLEVALQRSVSSGKGAKAADGGGSSSDNSNSGHGADFYFYTALPHLYLSPLDIRILKTKYGSFSSFPSTLLPRVEHISTGHPVDDSVRRRAKYLSHLPQGCLISFLECDWTDIVPPEVLAAFSDEIERRRKRNRDKAAQEERERLQAERLESAALRGAAARARTVNSPATEEEIMFRFGGGGGREVVNPEDFIPLGGTTPPQPRSGFSELATMSTSPSAPRTVWGTPALMSAAADGHGDGDADPSVVAAAAARHPGGLVDDGWLKDDQLLGNLSSSGGEGLALQVEALRIGQDGAAPTAGTGAGAGAGAGAGGGKKKKKQKITLMSTGGRRGN